MRFLTAVFAMVLGIVFSTASSAHVRWFVGNNIEPQPYSWVGADYLLLGIAASACIIATLMAKISLPQITGLSFFQPWPMQRQFRLLAIILGLWLLSNFYYGEFIAPNLEPRNYFQWSQWLQAICGVLLLISHRLANATLCLYFLLLQLMLTIPSNLWVDYVFEILGFALALSLSAKPTQAVTILRVMLGVQLIVLGIHNKLLNPTMGVEFLQTYPWNFLAMLNADLFKDANFIIGIGLAEVSLGLLLVAGCCTRLVALLVLCVFTLTGSLLGIAELLGHIPIVMAFIVIFSLGTGERNLALAQQLLASKPRFRVFRRPEQTC